MASKASIRKSWAKSVLFDLKKYDLTVWISTGNIQWQHIVAAAQMILKTVSLILELRELLGASGTSYGISFTTPASYWYLQCFDVPGILSAGAD
ncbi:hypothetical protein F1880_006828 [Penicillium rolfsii]|nr:hypothetical protein F1880_006828 [Penicillium rolfsii]